VVRHDIDPDQENSKGGGEKEEVVATCCKKNKSDQEGQLQDTGRANFSKGKVN